MRGRFHLLLLLLCLTAEFKNVNRRLRQRQSKNNYLKCKDGRFMADFSYRYDSQRIGIGCRELEKCGSNMNCTWSRSCKNTGLNKYVDPDRIIVAGVMPYTNPKYLRVRCCRVHTYKFQNCVSKRIRFRNYFHVTINTILGKYKRNRDKVITDIEVTKPAANWRKVSSAVVEICSRRKAGFCPNDKRRKKDPNKEKEDNTDPKEKKEPQNERDGQRKNENDNRNQERTRTNNQEEQTNRQKNDVDEIKQRQLTEERNSPNNQQQRPQNGQQNGKNWQGQQSVDEVPQNVGMEELQGLQTVEEEGVNALKWVAVCAVGCPIAAATGLLIGIKLYACQKMIIANITLTYTNDDDPNLLPVGESAIFACTDPAGTLDGQSTVECVNPFQWELNDEDFAYCLAACDTITVEFSSSVTYDNPYNDTRIYSTGVATVVCLDFYTIEPANSPTATCTDGIWSTIPTCEPHCDVWADILNAVEIYSATADAGKVPHRSTVDVTCDDGYHIGPADFTTKTCMSGTWDGDPPECLPDDCDMWADIDNGEIVHVTPTTNNTVPHAGTATVVCSKFYSIEPPGAQTEYTCNTGSWDGITADEFPECLENCDKWDDPANGVVVGTEVDGKIVHGDTATVTCDTGYHLDPDTVMTCNDGVWQGITPQCVGNPCSKWEDPINGVFQPTAVTGGTMVDHGTSVIIECNNGYSVDPVDFVNPTICFAGNWHQAEPSCKATCTILADPIGGQVVRQEARDPININQVVHGGVATVECDDGYTLDPAGQTTFTCTDGSWNPTTPTTCKTNCGLLTPPPTTAGAIVYVPGPGTVTTIPHDTTATLTCKPGYYSDPEGATTVKTCNNANWETGAMPTCTAITCVNNFANVPGVITHNPTTTPIAYNGMVTAVCVDTTTIVTNSPVTCVGKDTWDSTAVPTCEPGCARLVNADGITYDHSSADDPVPLGTTIDITCDSATSRLDDLLADTLECKLTGGTGSWFPDQLTACVAGCPDVVFTGTALGTQSYSFATVGSREFGSTMQVVCASGQYTTSSTPLGVPITASTNILLTCEADGTWKYAGGVLTNLVCNIS